jgi:hypothetical protein
VRADLHNHLDSNANPFQRLPHKHTRNNVEQMSQHPMIQLNGLLKLIAIAGDGDACLQSQYSGRLRQEDPKFKASLGRTLS